MIMLKIRKDVSYIIQMFYTTFKEVTVYVSQNSCINYNFFKRCYSFDNKHFEF